ncbi:MAG: porphobilinogen synthase, partial [Planctomycetales bacterium]|nr:porphobilinogen synthase [Planctomycetales bacterium]
MNANSQFPTTRLRRLRYNPAVRSLVRDVRLDPSKLILPLFVRSGSGIRQPISSMPGHAQLSVDLLKDEVREAVDLGLGGVILFGIPDEKDEVGSDSYCSVGIIQQGVRAAKEVASD